MRAGKPGETSSTQDGQALPDQALISQRLRQLVAGARTEEELLGRRFQSLRVLGQIVGQKF